MLIRIPVNQQCSRTRTKFNRNMFNSHFIIIDWSFSIKQRLRSCDQSPACLYHTRTQIIIVNDLNETKTEKLTKTQWYTSSAARFLPVSLVLYWARLTAFCVWTDFVRWLYCWWCAFVVDEASDTEVDYFWFGEIFVECMWFFPFV